MVTTIEILCFDGFEELDAIGPYEVLQVAASRGVSLDVSLVTLEARDRVTAANGLRIDPDGVLSVAAPPDVVVVPGGGWNDRGSAGAWAEAERGAVPDALAGLHDAGTTLAAVCTGGMLLARAGVLDGRPAVTHAGALDDLREAGAEVVDARYVDDGDVLTAGGITAGLDLALRLIERLADAETADAVATHMEYERRA
ncbi:DJ-1/PfpI family protein [Haloplanus salinus]|jgi:transcriptional regulator GlxA family with amidase domain|uniref:DJ-1/PfpI family protein n=1 Tax=Haloplanus salinus TaxID=1126245 RepID=A0A368N763_9EURY|nr:DJ-1/PfpI family protein [Haloplanus salinus]RCU45940.1 DJ-1/PfpI family protein [Haloplanus salinus]